MSAEPASLPKAKLFPYRPRSERLARLMQSGAFILAANWCLQGMRGMDRKELGFRLLAEALLVMAGLAAGLGAVSAFLLAHSLGFTLNGQLWVCARYCRAWHRDPAALEAFMRRTAAALMRLPWIDEAVLIGSRGQGGRVAHDRADLDLRLVVPPGLAGWLRANLLLLRLRAAAFLRAIPLDLYAYDGPASLDRFDRRERLLVLLDRNGRLARRYPDRVTPWPG